ncbi:MAG: ABC transporter permease subunit, partial [Nitrososphaerota archaeon]|nr:ABC transporter permease subunit [Nitrososphaerota archaeon]
MEIEPCAFQGTIKRSSSSKAMYSNRPTALPNIFAGLKVSITLAVIGALVAEFVSSNQGLGFLIISAQVQLDNTLAFAAATLLVAVGLLLYIALELLERLMVPWKAHGS